MRTSVVAFLTVAAVMAAVAEAADGRGRRGALPDPLLESPSLLLGAPPPLGDYVADHFAPHSLYSAPLLDPHQPVDSVFDAHSLHSSPIIGSHLLSSPLHSSFYAPSIHSPLLALPPLFNSYDSLSPPLLYPLLVSSAASASPATEAPPPATSARSPPAEQSPEARDQHRSESTT